MISLQTNLSSIITQNNLNMSTNKLNQAIERMSTGYKINHASDNAANYSISKNMNVQLSACDIAADNISMGMDLLQTAQDTISGMQERGQRIQALITQARNGTYGATSHTAMLSEAQAIASEINRLYMSTEYNGIKLFDGLKLPDWAEEVKAHAGLEEGITAGEGAGLTSDISPVNNGFIAEIEEVKADVVVEDAKELFDEINGKNTIIGIANEEVFAELAKIVNGDGYDANDCSGKTFVLTKDMNISAICEENTDKDGNGGWTQIGTDDKTFFAGTFDGQGHKISGLYIKNEKSDYQGLFGYATGEIKNIGVEGVNVTGRSYTGGLAGSAESTITNSYATGSVTGGDYAGGLAGSATTITNSYATGNVTGSGERTGGLAGWANDEITNSYATGNVTGSGERTGGLAGEAKTITNSYATGSVTGSGERTGGLAGSASAITDSYATGNVSGGQCTGGLAGWARGITNSYATGNVTGQGNYTGGLAGNATTITDSYATGSVTGSGERTGGLAGWANAITDSYATGNVSGGQCTGGLAGYAVNSITNSYSTGNVTGNNQTGGLAGYAVNSITNSYATGNVSGQGNYTGGLAGQANGGITNSYSTGNVTGTDWVGGLVGRLNKTSGTLTCNQILSSGKVSGDTKVGSLIGGIVNTSNGTSFSTITITNASARQGDVMIGFEGKDDGTAYESGQMEGWLENITALKSPETTLQVGTYGDESSQIKVDTSMSINLSISDLTSDSAYNSITAFLNQLSQKATEIGSAQNRLESALESNLVKMDNLTSSLSTIRDADIGKVSSDYIRQQILQQACATLMATANQSPSIALQLL